MKNFCNLCCSFCVLWYNTVLSIYAFYESLLNIKDLNCLILRIFRNNNLREEQGKDKEIMKGEKKQNTRADVTSRK